MSTEQLAETVGEVVERQRLLRRAGIAALGALGFAGLVPATARAGYGGAEGCNLCNPPSQGCGPNLYCSWCWLGSCVNGKVYNCCEGRQQGGDCHSPSCPSYCSWYTLAGSC